MQLIAGVDPGLNTGIACISLDSGTITTHTLRNASLGDICDYIISQGEPIIIASDVEPVPQTVKKISAAFSARLFYSQLSVSEKNRLAHAINYRNSHERDAFAAAESARKFFLPTFEKINNALERKGMQHLAPAVRKMLVRREAGNIESAVNFLTQKRSPALKKKRVRVEIKAPKTEMLAVEGRLKEKDEEIARLRKEIDILRNRNRDRTIETMRSTIDDLRKQLSGKERQLETMKRLLAEGFEIIVPFRDGEDVHDKVVLISGNSRMLGRSKPRAIIADKHFPASAPVLLRKDVEIISIGDILVAEKKKLEELIEKESFLQYLEKYKHRYEKTQ